MQMDELPLSLISSHSRLTHDASITFLESQVPQHRWGSRDKSPPLNS